MGKKRIYITPDGPYEVQGGIPLRVQKTTVDEQGASVDWVPGRKYEVEETYHLCRCGHSGEKPFCDGSHERVDFAGAETAAYGEDIADGTLEYSGPELTLIDNEALCASARFCDRGINAWYAVEDSGKEENKALAIEEVGKCPSGRLTLKDKAGDVIEPSLPQAISLMESTVHDCRGPLVVTGEISVRSADDHEFLPRNRMTLCRCGESKNKPFCDSTHVECPHMKGFDE
ncbi:CDGSH iron-sulfur domain-containing protein [Christensenellaceae bacterium OttesenSCG-928-K19]|nr:CDGSH iron-sulfur domain-containing protein [Christensenellaceae bacterium OttesenSCG-928-K19]